MTSRGEPFIAAAYGGEGWSPRTASLREEIGSVWGPCGVSTEWSRLKSVLLHRPGPELNVSADPNSVQMLEPLNLERAQGQHDAIRRAYEDSGVTVHYVEPREKPTPNQMFVADLMFMTPEGATHCPQPRVSPLLVMKSTCLGAFIVKVPVRPARSRPSRIRASMAKS